MDEDDYTYEVETVLEVVKERWCLAEVQPHGEIIDAEDRWGLLVLWYIILCFNSIFSM